MLRDAILNVVKPSVVMVNVVAPFSSFFLSPSIVVTCANNQNPTGPLLSILAFQKTKITKSIRLKVILSAYHFVKQHFFLPTEIKVQCSKKNGFVTPDVCKQGQGLYYKNCTTVIYRFS
jgi:hypothetical protein